MDISVMLKIGCGILPQVVEPFHPQWQEFQQSIQEICLQCRELDPAERATIDQLVFLLRYLTLTYISLQTLMHLSQGN